MPAQTETLKKLLIYLEERIKTLQDKRITEEELKKADKGMRIRMMIKENFLLKPPTTWVNFKLITVAKRLIIKRSKKRPKIEFKKLTQFKAKLSLKAYKTGKPKIITGQEFKRVRVMKREVKIIGGLRGKDKRRWSSSWSKRVVMAVIMPEPRTKIKMIKNQRLKT